MAGGYRADEIPLDRVEHLSRRMIREFTETYESIDKRRAHYNTWEKVDPILSSRQGSDPDPNDLLAQVSRFQSREIAIVAKKLVDRICENPWQLTMSAPDETATLEKQGNRIGQVLASWGMDIEDRQQMQIQRLLALNCVRDRGYAILHVRMCEDLWPEIDWEPSDEKGMSRGKKPYDCPGCMGEGEGEDGEPCPQCEGSGKVERDMLTLKGRGSDYVDETQRTWAENGSPWVWEVVDARNCAWREDNDPRGGIARFLRHYEVQLDDYADEQDDYDARKLRAAFTAPGDRHTDVSSETPSSEDYEGVRVTVYQLWTRTHLYEWCEGQGSQGETKSHKVKGGPHGYTYKGKPAIPFRVVAPRRTGHPDVFWRFEGDLDDMYAIKPWADKQVTLMSGAMENTVRPLLNDTMDDPGKAPYLPDGVPADGSQDGSIAGRRPMPGMKTEVITPPMPPSIVGFWQELKEMIERAKPEFGDVDLSSVQDAWAIRLGQAQGGKGPRAHVREHKEALDWAFGVKLSTHRSRGLRMVAYGRDPDSRRRNTVDPLVINADEIAHFEPNVTINDVSKAERQMEVEHNRGLLAEQLITHEDFYRVLGARDPHDEALKVMAYWVAMPYIMQAAQGLLAERMGSQFIMGPNGELMNQAGQPVQPEQVLQAKGYQPGMQPGMGGPPPGAGGPPGQPGGGGNGLAMLRGQQQMPGLPALNVPGPNMAPVPGMR